MTRSAVAGGVRHGALIDGQFQLERQLGAGGMGTVWAAHDLALGRVVAIKFMATDYFHDTQARQRFEREARMVGKIRSPHVVQVHRQGVTEEGVPYVVMEMLDGEDLSTRLANDGPCSLAETAQIVEQVCLALSRAHREGLVHRDIKPHNIFLVAEGAGRTFVKLLDFGIAKDVTAKLTALTLTGAVLGSVLYISPEQLHDAPSVGPSADLWALGVVIYQMLTGQVPFDGNSLPELVFRISEGSFTPATRVNPALPPEIDAFFARAIQPDRDQRFTSAEELSAEFLRVARAHASGFVFRAVARTPTAIASQVATPAPAVPTAPTPAPVAMAGTPHTLEPASSLRWALLGGGVTLLLAAIVLAVWSRMQTPAPAEPAAHEVQPAAIEPATVPTALPEQPHPAPVAAPAPPAPVPPARVPTKASAPPPAKAPTAPPAKTNGPRDYGF